MASFIVRVLLVAIGVVFGGIIGRAIHVYLFPDSLWIPFLAAAGGGFVFGVLEGYRYASKHYNMSISNLMAMYERYEKNQKECSHDWVDARNEVVLSGEICLKCQEVRAGNCENSL